ncbi:MAG: DUF5804 family protein [Salinirussus sp.]
MTRVCLVGADGLNLRYELLSRETAREALRTYDLDEPYDNTVAVETISLGRAVALCNDLDWYLARFARAALVLEPSVSGTEWLSRDLATAIRDDRVDPDDTGRFLRVYGVQSRDADAEDDGAEAADQPPRLVEPMLVARTGDTLPEYDLRAVEDTLRVRLTEAEFEE